MCKPDVLPSAVELIDGVHVVRVDRVDPDDVPRRRELRLSEAGFGVVSAFDLATSIAEAKPAIIGTFAASEPASTCIYHCGLLVEWVRYST